ncbi:MAG: hypothetical protein J2P45_26900, partial [Candidatus Dormibacteraeota bacterium]|nr:hypothetical protein [Candidatus Dormibacteraeota bacterium]
MTGSTRTLARPPAGVAQVPSSRHFVVSIFQFGASQAASWVGAGVLAVMLPRLLGDQNLGRLGFGLGLVTLVGLLANLGTATYLVKEVARRPERAAELTVNALAMRVPLTLVAAGVAVAVVTVSSHDQVTR